MNTAIQLYGYLVLTFLGIIAPFVFILLSIYKEGVVKLTNQYENEKAQSEKNIQEEVKKSSQEELEKIAKSENVNTTQIHEALNKLKEEIAKNLNELRDKKKIADKKLSYLRPRNQLLRLFVPLLLSFLGMTFALLFSNILYVGIFLGISIVCFIYTIKVLWFLLMIFIEVKTMIDDDRKTCETQQLNYLSLIAEKMKEGLQYFLKNIYITIDDKEFIDESFVVTLPANKKQELKLGIKNKEQRMAKNIEVGLILPSSFMIDKSDYYSIYTDENKQIVRYKANFIHGETHLLLSPLILTPLKANNYKIKTFINGENIETINRYFTIQVKQPTIDELVKEILKTMENVKNTTQNKKGEK